MTFPGHRLLFVACVLAWSTGTSARAETTPQEPAAPQPKLPQSAPASATKPTPPVVERIAGEKPPVLTVRARARRRHVVAMAARRHRAAERVRVPANLDRPALAGVELLAPLPVPGEPPHITVPLPAYPLDAIATAVTTPPPPIVCHPTRRDPDVPDPHLYREVPVVCEADNP